MEKDFVAEFSVQPSPKMTANFTMKNSGEGGVTDHDKLENRDIPDQHPIGAITGLEGALEGKQDNLTQSQIDAVNSGITTNKVEGYDSHLANENNPHNVTKSQVGLGNVDNTADTDKPISTATQTALGNKQNTITGGATTIVDNNLTTNRALVSNDSGKVAVSQVTSTELGYVSGTTSNIQNQIDNLKNRGRFLSLWNCVTGLAQSTPASLPYEYKTGDYFIVGTVGTTNYKPNGSQYTGVASTTVETSTVAVNDTFYYDGTNWILQVNSERDVSFSSIVGQPSENANLKTALDNKYDANNPNGYISKSGISADSPIAYNNSTGKISVASGYQIPTTSQVTQIETNTTNIALKANVASPEFTGTPKAPTASAGTNTTQVATTAFVKTAVENIEYVLQIIEW